MWPNEPDQPDPNLKQILTLKLNWIQLNPILDPEGPTRKRVGFKSGLLSTYRKVEVEFESYLRSTLPNWTHFLDLEGQPDPFEPENWTQNQVEPEKMS